MGAGPYYDPVMTLLNIALGVFITATALPFVVFGVVLVIVAIGRAKKRKVLDTAQ